MSELNFKEDIIYLIKHLDKLLQIDFDQRVSHFGLTGSQARVLFFINRKVNIEHVKVHQNDIQREFSLTKSTVNGLISRLLKTGYIIKRNAHPYVELEPTEEGKQILDQIRLGKNETIEKLFKGLPEEDKVNTINKLKILIENLKGGKE